MVGCPTPAERARTLVKDSLTVRVTYPDLPIPAHETTRRLMIAAKPALADDQSGPRCLIEIADAAPVATRERIRGRVVLTGNEAETTDEEALQVRVSRIELVEDGVTVRVPLEEFVAAEPDPLAPSEAMLLAHLAHDHADVLDVLVRLVDPDDLLGVVRVWPLRLDRCGIVLRLEYARGHLDRRLGFDRPVLSVEALNPAMALLIARSHAVARARACAARQVSGRGPQAVTLDAIARASHAARRLCQPHLRPE